MASLAVAGVAIFVGAVLIADFAVPDHDWIADTISDLGAGRLAFIVDIGIYAYSLSLIACAVAASHVHLGGRGWTVGRYVLIATGLIVFLVGARNEYGDGDSTGIVIHTYLVCALGLGFAVMPWIMSPGVGSVSPGAAMVCRAVTVLWVPLAPVFFFLPTGFDGLYERVLGGITFAFVLALAWTFNLRARKPAT